jgi:hypothetical protein
MKDGISAEDEESLGWKTTSKLFRVRDAYLLQMQYLRGYYSFSQFDYIVMPLIQEIFCRGIGSCWMGWVAKLCNISVERASESLCFGFQQRVTDVNASRYIVHTLFPYIGNVTDGDEERMSSTTTLLIY